MKRGLQLALRVSMDFITWIIVGGIAGFLAATLMRGSGLGIFRDVALGIAGAIVGSWSFHHLGWHAPLPGLAGVTAIAVVGAVLVLVVVRLATGRKVRS